MIFSESRVQYNFSFLCIKKWYQRLIFSKIIILVVLLITSSETLGHSGKDIIGQFEKINSYFEVGLSYSDYVSMLRETNYILNGYMKTPEADKNKSRTSKIVTLYQLYAGFVKELFEMKVKGKHVIKKYIHKTESLQLKNPVFENYASVFPELIFIESEYIKEPFFYVSDLFQKSLHLAKNRTDLLVAQLTQKETSKNQINNSGSIPLEDGIWKVNKFETKEKSGDAGAYFDGENIKLILYKRPNERKHEMGIITQGEQSWNKISNDINLIAFSYTYPDPSIAFSNYSDSQLTIWRNVKIEFVDEYMMGTIVLKIEETDINKLKQKKEIYILGWSKKDVIEDKGYSFVFRIPLKGSSKTINEALSHVSNAESLKNVSTTETIQKTRIGEEGDFESTLKKAEQGDSSSPPGGSTAFADTSSCGAYVAPGVWKKFDCYNLAAIGKTTNDDPFTPSWRLIGGYWQWGRKGPDPSQWHTTNTPHFAHGPTGPGSSEENGGSFIEWDSSDVPGGSWSDASKTTNDPCPAGFRVPTKAQWQGVLDNNDQNTVGTWSNSRTNYSSARFFGSDFSGLMLPAAGSRLYSSGGLVGRGTSGLYWSSSDRSSSLARLLYFGSSRANTGTLPRSYGLSVRCVSQ
jgi:uncharacterized protein (TIGR02145 family)